MSSDLWSGLFMMTRRSVYVSCLFALNLATLATVRAQDDPRSLEQLIKDTGPGFTIRVVDDRGNPVEGALAGLSFQYAKGKQYVSCNRDLHTTNARGELSLEYGRDFLDGGRIVACHEGRKLTGFVATTT